MVNYCIIVSSQEGPSIKCYIRRLQNRLFPLLSILIKDAIIISYLANVFDLKFLIIFCSNCVFDT